MHIGQVVIRVFAKPTLRRCDGFSWRRFVGGIDWGGWPGRWFSWAWSCRRGQSQVVALSFEHAFAATWRKVHPAHEDGYLEAALLPMALATPPLVPRGCGREAYYSRLPAGWIGRATGNPLAPQWHCCPSSVSGLQGPLQRTSWCWCGAPDWATPSLEDGTAWSYIASPMSP